MKKITILIPTYNEEEVLPALMDALKQVTQSLEQYHFEFLFVDDGSTDETTTLLQQFHAENSHVQYVELSRNFGKEIAMLADSDVVAVALPAASLGIGCPFTPARKLLDAGASLAIATDWNPGSAPMGMLVESASILATMEKLSNAEVLSAITFRAAHALNLKDRGRLVPGQLADFVIYKTDNYQNITYFQGGLKPQEVWKSGKKVV